MATPTTNRLDTVCRAYQLLQRSNSWTKWRSSEVSMDSQGKQRSRYDLDTALASAVNGVTDANKDINLLSPSQIKHFNAARNQVLRTLFANPKKYNYTKYLPSFQDDLALVTFNDFDDVRHADVLRLLDDTAIRIYR